MLTALVSELKIESLEQELHNANDLLAAKKAGSFSVSQEEVETMYPAAAATSKLLKSGMTLTQVNNLTQCLLLLFVPFPLQTLSACCDLYLESALWMQNMGSSPCAVDRTLKSNY